jgi:predicted nucleic acid-binding protein
MTTTYLDSCVVISATRDTEEGRRLRGRIASDPQRRFVISPLVRLESLVRPLRTGDESLIRLREALLDQFVSLSIDEDAFLLASHVRAIHRLSTTDALHVATANTHGCDELWTDDKRLAQAAPAFAVDVTESP